MPSQWEDESLYNVDFSGTKVSANGTTYYRSIKIPENVGLDLTIVAALDVRAESQISLKSHRDTEVTYTTFMNPTVQLQSHCLPKYNKD